MRKDKYWTNKKLFELLFSLKTNKFVLLKFDSGLPSMQYRMHHFYKLLKYIKHEDFVKVREYNSDLKEIIPCDNSIFRLAEDTLEKLRNTTLDYIIPTFKESLKFYFKVMKSF
jgi:hypothetical protein